jgi:uncharacterized membrane protein
VTSWLGLFAIWLATTVVTMLIAGVILVTLPGDYLREGDARPRHWTYRIIRSVVGILLVIVGLLLSLPGIPGQGVLTILAGMILIEFPGRHRIVRAIIGRPAVLKALNRLRARFGRPPLTLERSAVEGGRRPPEEPAP